MTRVGRGQACRAKQGRREDTCALKIEAGLSLRRLRRSSRVCSELAWRRGPPNSSLLGAVPLGVDEDARGQQVDLYRLVPGRMRGGSMPRRGHLCHEVLDDSLKSNKVDQAAEGAI